MTIIFDGQIITDRKQAIGKTFKIGDDEFIFIEPEGYRKKGDLVHVPEDNTRDGHVDMVGEYVETFGHSYGSFNSVEILYPKEFVGRRKITGAVLSVAKIERSANLKEKE